MMVLEAKHIKTGDISDIILERNVFLVIGSAISSNKKILRDTTHIK